MLNNQHLNLNPLSSMSGKDFQLFSKTYRKMAELYYESKKNQGYAKDLICLTSLIEQIVATKNQADKFTIISQMEILKVKAKNNTLLVQKIDSAINHLRAPTPKLIKYSDLLYTLQKNELFTLGSTIAIRFYDSLAMSNDIDWKEVINQIGINISTSPQLGIQLLNLICKGNQMHCRLTVKQGIMKYLFLNFIPSSLKDTLNLYKSFKLIKLVCQVQKTIIRQKQKVLATVLLFSEGFIPIVSDICNKCFDQKYCLDIINKPSVDSTSIDQPYVWSYNQLFCHLITQKIVSQLSDMLNQNLSGQTQTKIYAILYNYSKFCKYYQKEFIIRLPKHQESLLNYLKMCINFSQVDHKSPHLIDWSQLQILIQQNSNPMVNHLAKCLQAKKQKEVKIGSIDQSIQKMFTPQKNIDFLSERVSKVPQNNVQLQDIKCVMMQKSKNNEFESDNFHMVKQKALQSLKKAVIQNKKIDLNIIIKNIELNDVTLVAKTLNIVQLNLMMHNDLIDKIDFNRILIMMEWIEEHYDGQIIDWGSIGQLLIILSQSKEWKRHIGNWPNRQCFWILGIQQLQEIEAKQVIEIIQKLSRSDNQRKLALMIGFFGKVMNKTQKLLLLKKCGFLFQMMYRNLSSNNSYKLLLMSFSYFIKGWHLTQDDDPNWKTNNQQFQILIGPIVMVVLSAFRSLPQQYYFLQCCLPYEFKGDSISANLESLASHHGKLTAYLYKQKSKLNKKAELAIDKIPSLNSLPPQATLQTLRFFKQNDELIRPNEFQRLLDQIQSKKDSYWQYYPSYVDVVGNITQIIGSSKNTNIKTYLTDMIIKIIRQIQNNQNIVQDQKEELLQQIKFSISEMKERGVYIDIQRVRKVVTTIIQNQIREEIIYILNHYKVTQTQTVIKQQRKSQIDNSRIVFPQSQTPTKVQNLQSFQVLKYPKDHNQIIQEEEALPLFAPTSSSSSFKQMPEQIKQQVSIETRMKDMIGKQPTTLVKAFELLNKIVNNLEPVPTFISIYNIFEESSLTCSQMQLLGQLLVKFYHLQNNPKALSLLLNKQKTNLTKQQLQDLVFNYIPAFALVKRFKLQSRKGLDIAMVRIKQGFISQACQVAQYNLSKTVDIQYFYSQKYHLIAQQIRNQIQTEEQIANYLLLIGTSARLPQIRHEYITKQLHTSIIHYIKKYSQSHKILSNLCYAESSLVYEEQNSCLDIVKQRQSLMLVLSGIKKNKLSKSVIEPGVCFLANLTYSTNQVKEIMRTMNIVDLLMDIFNSNLQQAEMNIFKQLLRAMGNISISKLCSQQLILSHFSEAAVRMTQALDIFVCFDDKKARLMKLLIDLIANIASHKNGLQNMHKQKLTLLIITVLQTTQHNPQILMGCIDTIDAFCQNQQIQKYLVTQKKLPYVLIDILKIQEDPKIVLKATRLLTNLTIHPLCIPFILKANLLSVLANVVMPHVYLGLMPADQVKKMEGYIVKTITRIHQVKPDLELIMKSGFLQCLLKVIETMAIDDSFIEMLFKYSQHLPSFLNKRAFSCLIKVLTEQVTNKTMIQKCIHSLKNLLSFSYDKQDEEIFISSIPQMYEKFLESEFMEDALFLLGYHLLRCHQLRVMLKKKEDKIIEILSLLSKEQRYTQISKSIIFLIYNSRMVLWLDTFGNQSEQNFYDNLRKGFKCMLYRSDGSHKEGKIDIDQQYNIRAYKYPNGDIKKKYFMNIRYVKDLQIDYSHNQQVWKKSVFDLEKGFFDSHIPNPNLCVTLIGNSKWGQINFINIEFDTENDKLLFYRSLSHILAIFRG